MLPLQQAQELRAAISEYLKATFTFREQKVHDAFHSFINHPKDGMYKGPYVSIDLPFKKADPNEEIPLEIRPDFTPFLHQSKAFKRLSSTNGEPQPTLLTTGTGSGKTESFLFPILDYCYKNRDKKGIKAIILYPMNALATDQAQRLAETIWNDERLKGNITAGLFIGTGSGDKKYHSDMGPDHIIENRDRIIDTKPDILLTNFKMLDYGLMRNRYHKLWTHNFADPSLLKFLVLDELHTYDGAQGTDVANLIRRLKLKLHLKRGELCPIGTSATIGEGEESTDLLTDYAEKIYGESFPKESVITEERLSIDQFLKGSSGQKKPMPKLERIEESRLKEKADYDTYIRKQLKLWDIKEVATSFEIGEALKELQVFHDLLAAADKGLCDVSTLINRISAKNIRFKDLAEWDDQFNMSPRHVVVESLLALISYAKSDESGKWPFLLLRIQVWIRELSGIMRLLETEPTFTWRDKKDAEGESVKSLPMYYCRECGASGWLSKKSDNHEKFESDTGEIFKDYFDNHKNIYFINTDTDEHQPIEEYNATTIHKKSVSKESLELSNDDVDGDTHIKLIALRKLDNNGYSDHVCSECGNRNSVSIVGTRSATLTSVGVSQSLSSNLDQKADGYRKLLAFTNGVQDAAHNAGFIEARNYRFMFRTSLQQVVNEISGEISLTDLIEAFKSFWKKRSAEDETYYYRFYPDDCAKKAPIGAYKHSQSDKFIERFKQEFDLRMDWEILSEYGFSTLIGRTLEKTGSSATWVQEDYFQDIYTKLKPWMDSNMMADISEEDLKLFVSGIIYRLRVRGAIGHPFLDKFREEEIKVWNLNWLRDKRHFLNRTYHQSKSRFPKLLTTKPHSNGILDTTHTNYQNWYHDYFKKSFQIVDNQDIRNEFYVELLEALTELGVTSKKHANRNNEISYALEPGIFNISTQLKVRECDRCGHKISTAEHDPYLGYSKCQQYRCGGQYSKEVKQEYNYYNKVFNREYSPRVISHEHTGILERETREEIEESFKSNKADRSINALIATSTLEMGIDIGQLETSFNVGLPPLPANYMQRVGRAGRSSGSSLISNFVSQKNPHDLYYFEAPVEMMDGEIHTPGCFLNAPEILQRQFLAHCIDRWVSDSPENHTIPIFIGHVKLLTVSLRDSELFLNRLLKFINENLDKILKDLEQVYKPELNEEQLTRLRQAVEHGGFNDWVLSPFYSLKSRLEEIQNQRKDIDEYIRERNLAEGDDERKSLEENKKALYKTQKKLNSQQVLEFMTLSGLLPNYSFPDKGVELAARIFQPKPEGADSKATNISKEYVRPASQAIRELAPHNTFVAEGYKFAIQGLMTHEWGGQRSTLEPYRFCSNCDYIALDTENHEKYCPKCSDPSFGAASNVHQFAEMSGVKSEVIRDKAALDDSSDERSNAFYKISRHAIFNEGNNGSLALVDIPFGIELAKNVELFDVNLGLIDTINATKIQINDNEAVPRHGFVTCKTCGYSTNQPGRESSPNNKSKYKFHYPYCKHRATPYNGDVGDIFEEVYLYRKQQTEVLKILLPVQTYATDEFRHIFKAGIELGLKEFYKGNPAHLSFLEYREFNPTTNKFDQYLLLYDRVPGGTGYLSKLFDKENFSEILEKAYLKIKNCTCQHEGNDGCYHCVYSYRNQYVSSVLSRKKAEEIFEDLLKHSSNWKELDHSLSDVTKNGQIEESELEERFLLALEKWCKQEGWKFEKHHGNEVQSYHITIPLSKDVGSITYWIKPQVNLGASDGVNVSTRPDFVFTPVETEGNGELYREFQDIAVYLDGYQYHASKEHNRFESDIIKRKAILDSHRYKVWTFTWDDVDGFIKCLDDEEVEFYRDGLSPDRPEFNNSTLKLKQTPEWEFHQSTSKYFDNSLSRFLGILTLKDDRKANSIGVAAMRYMSSFPFPNVSVEQLSEFLEKRYMPSKQTSVQGAQLAESYMKSNWSDDFSFYSSRVAVLLRKAELFGRLWYDENLLEEVDKEDWNRFWSLWNVLQYGDFEVEYQESIEAEESEDIDRELIFELYDVNLHPFIEQCLDAGIKVSEDGSFLKVFDGRHAEAKLGFEQPKVVFHPLSDEDEAVFKKRGYEIANLETFDLNRLRS